MNNKNFYINEEQNYIELYLNEKIYNLSIIKKALYNFIDDGYFILNYADADADTIIAKIFLKEHTTNKELFVKELYNELFNESIRFDVMKQTKNIRELILGRALYSTCIDTEKNENEEKNEMQTDDNNYNINNIAVNWFEGNNKN
ncbi:MAG TPA: His-Xaa-Ser system protein HxsD [Clostridiaceae bacterium]|jgi:hypothetical protein|nr:His-Xaa-Ser system protein HxsD [Clostridiaceae bacterium]